MWLWIDYYLLVGIFIVELSAWVNTMADKPRPLGPLTYLIILLGWPLLVPWALLSLS